MYEEKQGTSRKRAGKETKRKGAGRAQAKNNKKQTEQKKWNRFEHVAKGSRTHENNRQRERERERERESER